MAGELRYDRLWSDDAIFYPEGLPVRETVTLSTDASPNELGSAVFFGDSYAEPLIADRETLEKYTGFANIRQIGLVRIRASLGEPLPMALLDVSAGSDATTGGTVLERYVSVPPSESEQLECYHLPANFTLVFQHRDVVASRPAF